MRNPEAHSWRTTYRLAVLEPDRVQLGGRIDTALNAIEERLRQPLEIGSPEYREIEAAEEALAILKIERTAGSN